MSLNVIVLFGIGAVVGFFSGMLGVGGGFLVTPLLMFYNIPPAIAVGTGANQVIASSVTGALAHFKRRTLDIKLGVFLVIAGIIGSLAGVRLFSLLQNIGQLDLIISLLYVVLLGSIGLMMAIESIRAIRHRREGAPLPVRRPGHHRRIHRLPFKVRFRTSKLYVSVIPVLVIGLVIGLLSSIMGVGGGFIMVPALIYILQVPTNVVVGTSLFQITFVSAFTTVIQSVTNQSVDIVLAMLLMAGGVIGAQYGTRAGAKLRGEQLRILLALVILVMAAWLGFRLFIRPGELYTLTLAG